MRKGIELYSFKEIEKIRKACQVVAEILQILAENVKPGVTPWDLEMIAREEAKRGEQDPPSSTTDPPSTRRGIQRHCAFP
ncbi:MAG: hypothetical protein Q9N34_08590 [Aquificota bacterium]|nr:hypothetical protein [Aquificota bacterium]